MILHSVTGLCYDLVESADSTSYGEADREVEVRWIERRQWRQVTETGVRGAGMFSGPGNTVCENTHKH